MTQLEQDLIETRALISREVNWCQGSAYAPGGAMCLMGALRNVVGFCGTPDDARMFACVEALSLHTGGRWLAAYNDSHTHPEVIALLDRAILDEKAKRGVEELKELLDDSHPIRDLPGTGSRATGEVKADA